jgi:hypothetical protein
MIRSNDFVSQGFSSSSDSVAIYMQGYRDIVPTIRSFEKNFPDFGSIPLFVFHYNSPWAKRRIEAMERRFPNLRFIELFPSIPSHVSEKELFWNKSNAYAANFGPDRLGYLHMCHIASDVGNLPEVKEFDLALQIDDDISLLRKPDFDVFDAVATSPGFFGTSSVYKHVHQKNLDTREGLFEFVKWYVSSRGIVPKNEEFAKAILNGDEDSFHRLGWSSCNFNLYRMAEFRTSRWEDWISEVNRIGGAYRFRWGDQEIIGVYGYLYFTDPYLNFDLELKNVVTPKRRWTLAEYFKNRAMVIRD